MVEHDGLMRVFWPTDVPKSDRPGVVVGWRNSNLDVFVVAILDDTDVCENQGVPSTFWPDFGLTCHRS